MRRRQFLAIAPLVALAPVAGQSRKRPVPAGLSDQALTEIRQELAVYLQCWARDISFGRTGECKIMTCALSLLAEVERHRHA